MEKKKNSIHISVVIPIYGCRAALSELYKRLTLNLQKITDKYEIIMVNDNCPQNSWEIIQDICNKDEKVVGIELSRNFGQMKAILAGLDYSSGDYVVVMDCDLQDRPEEIANMYKKLQEGYDIVFARRKDRKDSKFKKFVSKRFYKLYSLLADVKYDETICNFSIITRDVANEYCKMRECHRAYVMYLQWLGYKEGYVDVEHNERYEGKSSYNMKKRIRLATDIIFSQSDKLLRIIACCGFGITLLSIIAIIILIINYFACDVSTGWTSIVAIECLLSGIIMSSIGVVGIYIGNIFIQTKDRPLYVIRSILNKRKEEK